MFQLQKQKRRSDVDEISILATEESQFIPRQRKEYIPDFVH